jgi:PAS domain S-box-containing protein
LAKAHGVAGIDTREPANGLDQDRELLLRAQILGRTGYVISDALADRVYWSDSLFEIRKIPKRPYFTRKEALDFFHPNDRVNFAKLRDTAIEARKSFTTEWRFNCGDGSQIWERGIVQPQYDAEGRYVSLLTVTSDITETKRNQLTLRDQEVTYRTLFDGMGDAIILNNNGVFEDCNAAALEMFRCTFEQLIGKTPDIVSPDRQPDGRLSAESAAEKIAAALHGERQFFEWKHKRFDGTLFDAEVTINRVNIPGQNYFFGIIRDITARKAAAEALKDAHGKFAGAFESSTDAMLVGEIGVEFGAGTIVDANPAVETTFGFSPAEMIGRSVSQLGLIPDQDNLRQIRSEIEKEQTLQAFPVIFRKRDGELREMELSGSGFRAAGKLHYLMIARDVTERNDADRKIRELNESLAATVKQLRDITDNAPLVIVYQDRDMRLRFVNQMMEKWFAKSKDEMIGKTIDEFAPPEYVEQTQIIRQHIARGDPRSEIKVRFPDGIERIAEGTRFPDVDSEGVLRGYYTVMTDITERRATEDQLHQSQKMQAIGKLTGGVAHDFNNLLAVILGNLEMAIESVSGRDDGVARLLAPALRAAERGVTLTRSLLAFARRQPLDPTVIDLPGLMRDMTNLLRHAIPANIDIEFVSAGGLWKCEADAGQLQNALLNLAVNSRDAMPDGGKLTIETGNVRLDAEYAATREDLAAGQFVMIAVSDTGTGMSPEAAARAFEPFYTTKSLGHGTGLGLSMVYGFAKQSGGHAAIYSEPGHGTTVRIYLPRWIGKADKIAPPKTAAIPSTNNERILVVEDDEDVRFITVTMLRSLGYNVLEAAGGNEALLLLRETENIALLVTDIMLSGPMNGKKVATEAEALQPGIRILYMSGYSENAIIHHGRLDQGVHFIQKPFRKQDMAQKVRQALSHEPD